MKKILLTIVQLAVTVGLLFLVYHDAQKRAEMEQALRHAREYGHVLERKPSLPASPPRPR